MLSQTFGHFYIISSRHLCHPLQAYTVLASPRMFTRVARATPSADRAARCEAIQGCDGRLVELASGAHRRAGEWNEQQQRRYRVCA